MPGASPIMRRRCSQIDLASRFEDFDDLELDLLGDMVLEDGVLGGLLSPTTCDLKR